MRIRSSATTWPAEFLGSRKGVIDISKEQAKGKGVALLME